jgi:chemotaxis regulatin CheY-phosphate phosphatase CheZ
MPEDLQKLIEQMEFAKELAKDVRDNTESHSSFARIKELTKELKAEREKLNNDPDVGQAKEELATARERVKLLREILVAKMREEGKDRVSSGGKEAVLTSTIKIGKPGAKAD